MFDFITFNELNDNRLLSALPDDGRYSLAPHFEIVELLKGQILDVSESCAYFPVDSVVSLVSTMEDERMQLAMVGFDGATGVYNSLGFNSLQYKSVVHVPGRAYRIESEVLRRHFQRSSRLSAILMQYLHAVYAQIAQVAICYRRHRLQQRLQTWMTMMFNRLKTDNLEMKQNEIAEALGYARQSISAATAALQQEEIIRYSRGYINLLDRAGLERGACECYSIMEAHYGQIKQSALTETDSVKADSGARLNELANLYIEQLGRIIDNVHEICDKNDSVFQHQRTVLNLKDAQYKEKQLSFNK